MALPGLVAPVKIDGTNALVKQLAPQLFDVWEKKDGTLAVAPTADVFRFLKLEAAAMGRSSLAAREVPDRPMVGVRPGWRLEGHALPLFVETVAFTHDVAIDPHLLDGFLEDLKQTFFVVPADRAVPGSQPSSTA